MQRRNFFKVILGFLAAPFAAKASTTFSTPGTEFVLSDSSTTSWTGTFGGAGSLKMNTPEDLTTFKIVPAKPWLTFHHRGNTPEALSCRDQDGVLVAWEDWDGNWHYPTTSVPEEQRAILERFISIPMMYRNA